MKRSVAAISILLAVFFCLSGCSDIGDTHASLSYVYFGTTLLSFIMLIGCIAVLRKKRVWFITLFTSVCIVNIGYSWLSASSCLEMALHANRLAYLGSVFLPLSMLMIILDATNTNYRRFLPFILLSISMIVFLVAASPGVLDIYYSSVAFEQISGVSRLIKTYGPLHKLYLFYLLGYFSAMVAIIIRSAVRKTVDALSHAVILAIAVFVNLAVWFAEQLVDIEFEMLSVSYIISELFLLGVHLVMNENQRLKNLVAQIDSLNGEADDTASASFENAAFKPEKIKRFLNGIDQLTVKELAIYNEHTTRATSKEIMERLCITENTLKFHNKNIYSKLGVSSRNELLALHEQVSLIKNNLNSQ